MEYHLVYKGTLLFHSNYSITPITNRHFCFAPIPFYSFHYSYSRPPSWFCSYSILLIPLILFQTIILFLLLFEIPFDNWYVDKSAWYFIWVLLCHTYHTLRRSYSIHSFHYSYSRPSFCLCSYSIIIIPLGTVHYLRVGGGDFEGATYFWQVAEGGHLFLARKIYKKPAKPQFLCISGKFPPNFFYGGTFFGRKQL